ncbi:MAG: hypothetical protein ACI97A_003486 [Planctomycetota bacterium]|jgi:hypothetical protein
MLKAPTKTDELRYPRSETIRLREGLDVFEIRPNGSKQSGMVSWQNDEIKWHIESDIDFPEETILTLESNLFPHGWTSRVLNLGTEVDLDSIFSEWPRPSTI